MEWNSVDSKQLEVCDARGSRWKYTGVYGKLIEASTEYGRGSCN